MSLQASHILFTYRYEIVTCTSNIVKISINHHQIWPFYPEKILNKVSYMCCAAVFHNILECPNGTLLGPCNNRKNNETNGFIGYQ